MGENKNGETDVNRSLHFLLAHLDSNQDKLNQNQLYYHYTMGQTQLQT
jgi:hypothetical protein